MLYVCFKTVLICMLFAASNVYALDQKMSPWKVTHHWAKAKIKPTLIIPSQSLRKLEQLKTLDNKDVIAAQDAADYLESSEGAFALMLIKNGEIVYEGYKGRGKKLSSKFYSQSIAKSLTGLVIGKAFCDGLIKSLDDAAGVYVPELNSSNLGNSSIKDLLRMSSGVYYTSFVGWPSYKSAVFGNDKKGHRVPNAEPAISNGTISISEMLWGVGLSEIGEVDVAKPGTKFVYKAYDPNALSKVIERASGKSLAKYFEEVIWSSIGAESAAEWSQDVDGTNLGSAGFAAKLRDWGRLGIWILEERKKDSCLGSYLREATVKQIDNKQLFNGSVYSGRSYAGYGFLWWVDAKDNTPGFWGKGYAGQYFGFYPEGDKILIKFGYKDSPGLNKLFKSWAN